MVEKPFEIGVDDLIRKMPLEERVYRLRCVEAWSMTIPWTGFPLAKLVELAKPLSWREISADGNLQGSVDGARPAADLVSVALYRGPHHRGGQQRSRVPGHRRLRQARAAPDGRAAPSRGAVEIRLQVGEVDRALHFTDKRPKSYWESLQAREYGFWANVNPKVDHPRWSQATEEVIGQGGKRVPTLLFNGYGEWVADLYKGLDSERLYA